MTGTGRFLPLNARSTNDGYFQQRSVGCAEFASIHVAGARGEQRGVRNYSAFHQIDELDKPAVGLVKQGPLAAR